jgi:LysR family glycine cleavage system transcriptional activator
MQIPLQAFYTFFVVCRAGSMKDAAQELSVTAGAISQRISDLESQLGQRLFQRARSGVMKTDAGAELYAELKIAFKQIETVSRHRLQEPGFGCLVVSVMPSFASSWLVPRLGRFVSRYPKISLSLETESRMVDLKSEPVDFAIRHGLGKYPGLEARWLMSPELIVVGSPEILRKGPPISSPLDCLAYTLLHDSDRRDWGLWLQAHGVASQGARRGLSFTDESMLVRAAADGQGLALVRDIYATKELEQGRLVKALEIQWPTELAYYLVGLSATFSASTSCEFVEWIQGETREMISS